MIQKKRIHMIANNRMSLLASLAALWVGIACGESMATAQSIPTNRPSSHTQDGEWLNIDRQLVKKHDANGNGKIDVSERPAYVKERSEARRASARNALAEYQRTKSGGDGPLLNTRRGQDILRSMDSNKDGRLDARELSAAPEAVWATLRVTRTQLDQNKDSVVDPQELKAFQGRPAASAARNRDHRSRPEHE